MHHIDVKTDVTAYTTDVSDPINNFVKQYNVSEEIDNTPLSRQVYITSSNDVTITHGLVTNSTRISSNSIPVTNRTPQGLTYGGSAQTINTQTNYGPGGTPLQFMQPSPKDYQDFGFGLLPSNADGQAFATPDATNGLRDATNLLAVISGAALNTSASNYYLCLHYALYQKPIPSNQG